MPFAESFDLNLKRRRELTTVKQLIPDVEALEAEDPYHYCSAIAGLRCSLFYRNRAVWGRRSCRRRPQPVRLDGYVDFRTTGRDIRLRLDMALDRLYCQLRLASI